MRNFTASFKQLIFLLLYLSLFGTNVRSENACSFNFQIKNYQPREYLANPQNWDAAQDNRGIMYFANSEGLLQYDGVSWRLFPLRGRSAVRSIDVDSAGTVFVGGAGCLGYMRADKSGRLQFISLKESIDKKYRDFLEVWDTFICGSDVLFRTKKYIFRIPIHSSAGMKKTKIWPAKTAFLKMFRISGQFYVRQQNIGLMRLTADSLKLIPGGKRFSQTSVVAALPYESDKTLFFTAREGLFLYDGSRIRHFSTDIEDRLKNEGIYKAAALPNGEYVISVFNKGLLFIDKNGRLKNRLNKNNGLADNMVHTLYFSRQNLLWAGLNNGISRIEINSPWVFYDNKNGLEGIINKIVRHNDKLYAACTNGLFSAAEREPGSNKKSPSISKPLSFEKIDNVGPECWDLLSLDKFLLAAASSGLHIIGADKNKILFKGRRTYSLQRSKSDSNRIWIGLKNEFASIYYRDNTWAEEKKYPKVSGNVRTILESEDGALWLSIENKGIIRLVLEKDLNGLPAVYNKIIFSPENSFVNIENNIIWQITGHEVFAYNDSIFRFDKNRQRFTADSLFYSIPELKHRAIMNLTEDKHGNVWIVSNDKKLASHGPKKTQISVLRKQSNGLYIWQNSFLQKNREAYIFSIYADNNYMWFGGNEGLIRFNPNNKKNYDLDFLTSIRKVQIKGGAAIYYGRPNNIKKKLLYPEIKYALNSIRFEYAAAFYETEESTVYQYMLQGFDETWSAWSNEYKMYYPGLPEGDYIFRVRAKNIFNHISREANFTFKILPPWYRSWQAYISYGFLVFIIILLLIKWRSAHLEKEKKRLEKIIAQRTEQIRKASNELALKNKQLSNQADKLKQMDQIKTNFFTNISHEFRTPLTLILGPLQKMLGQRKSPAFKPDLQLMEKNAQRLLALINQLLDLSKLEYGKMQLELKEADLNKFLKISAGSFQSLAAEKGTILSLIEEQQNIILPFDPQHLQKIMNNLLSNACKFTPPGGKIEVIVRRPENSGFAEIVVRDTGIGIEKEHLAHLFDRFYQVDSAQNRNYEGSGIGLALTKELVELHKGSISAASELGKGTIFTIYLPFVKTDTGNRLLNSEYNANDNLRVPNSWFPDPPIKSQPPKLPPLSSGLHSPLILVVEDNPDMSRFICENLNAEYKTISAEKGTKGLKIAFDKIPDLIISDVMMPGMDGFELLRRLKKDDRTSHIPVILLTARAGEESKIEGLESGADAYLNKPFNITELNVRAKNLIEQRKKLREKFEKKITIEPSEITVTSVDERFLKQALKVVERHMDDSAFSVIQFSEEMAVSRIHLHRKLKALTNQSASRFIRAIRLKRAAHLIQENSFTISEIAYKTGFTSASYFNRCFKQTFGSAPSKFEKTE